MAEPTPQHVYRVSEIRDGEVRRAHGYYASLQGAFGYCETEERKKPLIDSVRFELFAVPGGTQWLIHEYYGPKDTCPETSDFVISKHEVIPDEPAAPVSPPVSRADVLREAADALQARGKRLAGEFNDSDILHEDGPAATVATWKRAAEVVTRMADEEQTRNEAHPPEHTWAAELHDPLAEEWVPGTRYNDRDRAVKHLAHARSIGPTWKDGTPVQRRLVRATTTYTVEDPS